MSKRVIDLSLTIENEGDWAPERARASVQYSDHEQGRDAICKMFDLQPKHLSGGLGWAVETMTITTHGATHVDAPWHYSPTSGGARSKTIDEIPLEWCHGPGVVLDIRHLDPMASASVEDVKEALDKAQHTLSPGDIVLLRTGNDAQFGTPEYYHLGPGASAAATHFFIDHGVRLMGIDAWGWDRPLIDQARVARETDRAGVFWEAHYVGIEREYCQIERLANLGSVPSTGFTVCAFPLKIKGASAGLSRVVAIIE